MMIRKIVFTLFITVSGFSLAQGYEIKVNFKNCKDTLMYLVRYQWEQQYISDTAKKVKDGVAVFKGKKNLEKGVYTLVSQSKLVYFDFFINENSRFGINVDNNDIVNTLSSLGNKENEQFFQYIKFITNKNKELIKLKEDQRGNKDSAKIVAEKIASLNEEVKKFDDSFMQKNKGSFLYDVMNLKSEKEAKNVPKASNGRPDSIFVYQYYKDHYWDGVNFKDERIIKTPFFDDKVKKYFDHVIVTHPDTAIVEIDRILAKCAKDSLVYNSLIGYFTYKYEQSKIMGFDKVFVHLADKYIISGNASKVYSDETVSKIKDRVNILRGLLLEAKVAELYMIDTTNARAVLKMGFDTAKTSKGLTDLYYKNLDKLTPMFKTLYSVNAKYTVLVFWASDCGHCQTEIPRLKENLSTINGKIDFKVFAVQTKEDYEEWRKFIIKNKIDFINVFDPVHLNNLKERFDIYSTPVIYILDKDKRIMAKRLSADQTVEMLKVLDELDKKSKK